MKIIILILMSIVYAIASDIYGLYSIVADKQSYINTSISGVVKKMYVDVGSNVKQGDTLLELDNDELKKSIQIDKANLAIAQESYNYASSELDRYSKIKSSVTAQTIDKLQHEKNIQQANIKLSIASIEYKETQLQKTYIKAPFSGTITQKNVDEGTLLSQMNTALTMISDKKKLVIEYDDKYSQDIKIGSIYKYKLSTDKEYTAKIDKVYNFVDTKTKRAKAEATISDGFVGQIGDGYIVVGK